MTLEKPCCRFSRFPNEDKATNANLTAYRVLREKGCPRKIAIVS
jgi:hypothetical protein